MWKVNKFKRKLGNVEANKEKKFGLKKNCKKKR